ncbi:MAG: N utilization substance protein B [Verrucomicrobiales bacterium]|jgi:N utilization substance protein B
MSKRREGREAAVQFLFSSDLNSEADESDWSAFWKLHNANGFVRKFCTQLVDGVDRNREAIDARICDSAENYALDRLSTVDRNILRVAVYEMFHCEDVPPIVAINEAIEIAKRFGSEESGRFVNGVLDRLKRDLNRPLRQAAPKSGPTTAPSSPAEP